MNAQTSTPQHDTRTTSADEEGWARTVLVIDRELPAGLAANAAAVLALTLGALRPGLQGPDFADGSGEQHPGLFPAGLPVLAASAADLSALRRRARERGIRVVDFPSVGQQTNDYGEFRRMVAGTPEPDLRYLGVALHGPAKAVRAVTGGLPLLR